MKSKLDTDHRVSKWVASKYPDAKSTLIVDHPWAKTWRINAGQQNCYVKHIIRGGQQKASAAKSIADRFGETVPKVLDVDSDLSIIVVEDHNGDDLKSRSKNMAKVLPTYARLQVKAIQSDFQSHLLPNLKVSELYDELLGFLDVDTESDPKPAITRYLLEGKAREFRNLFAGMRPILEPFLHESNRLPRTINHCDLRPPNMAKRSDGSIAIFDWDDACWGPAGLSLHAQFSGCERPFKALNATHHEKHPASVWEDRSHLDQYLRPFEAHAIMTAEEMRRPLASAITVGAIYYVLNFRGYEDARSGTRKVIGKNITKRLKSVLNVVDLLAQGQIMLSRDIADIYFANSEWVRLANLQKQFKSPLIKIARLNDGAIEHSRAKGSFPAIDFTDRERECGVCMPETANLAAQIYREQGAVMLRNSLDISALEECKEHLYKRYDEYFQDQRPKDSLRVGNKRFMITLEIEGPLNRRSIIAPPTIMPILERLLSPKLILGSMVAVTSLPGARDQSRHRDHHALYPNEDIIPPPFATSVMIPLIEMNEEVGVTRLFKGTHLQPTKVADKMPHQDPVVPLGSCFLMDYRVQHRGMANKSADKIRPVITLVFQRPWFRDYVNYSNQDRMIISAAERARVPQECKRLLDWK